MRIIILLLASLFTVQASLACPVGGDCENAISRVSSVEKKCVIQPISAIQADINYHVRFSDNIAASDKATILRKASGALTTDGQADTSDSIIGKDLFVGLKMDTWCMVLDKDGVPGKSVASLPITPASFVIRLSE